MFKFFKLDEFDCQCCGKNWIKIEFVKKLDQVRAEHGHPIKILSGYRCYEHNKSVGGKRNSQHVYGNASDITSENMDQLYSICCNVFKAVGDGRNRGFLHVDGRPEEHRWTY